MPRTYLNVSTGLRNVGRCPHVHDTPEEAGRCAEDRLHHARLVSGQSQSDVTLTVAAADPDTGIGTATLPLDAGESGRAEAARADQREKRAHELLQPA